MLTNLNPGAIHNNNSRPEIDFNINRYSVGELESLLSLTKPYSEDQIKASSQALFNKEFFLCPVNNQSNLREFIDAIPKKLEAEIRIVIPQKGMDSGMMPMMNTVNNMSNSNDMNNTITSSTMGANNMSNTNNKWINIDSRFRKGYFTTPASRFQVQLPSRVNKAISMEVDSLQVPATFYTINSAYNNNNFIIVINNDDETFQVTLPDGNYSIDELIIYFNRTVFSTEWDAAPNLSITRPTIGGQNRNLLLAKYLTSTGKFLISVDNDANAAATTKITKFSIDFMRPSGSTYNGTSWSSDIVSGDIQTRLGWMLGYRNASYSGSTAYPGEAAIDICGPKYIYLVVDDYQNNGQEPMITALAESQLSKNILAKIPVTNTLVGTNHFSNITLPLKNKQCERRYLRPVDIETLNISLIDDYGRQLIMNSDWNCTLVISCIYEV